MTSPSIAQSAEPFILHPPPTWQILRNSPLTMVQRRQRNRFEGGKMNVVILAVVIRHISVLILKQWGSPDYIYYTLLYPCKRLPVLGRRCMADAQPSLNRQVGCWESSETRLSARRLDILNEQSVDLLHDDMGFYLQALSTNEFYLEEVSTSLHVVFKEGHRLHKQHGPAKLEEENTQLKSDLLSVKEDHQRLNANVVIMKGWSLYSVCLLPVKP